MRKFLKWMPISMMVLGGMFMMAGCSDDNEPATEEPGTENLLLKSPFSLLMKRLR